MRILIVDDEPLELDQLEWMIHSFDPSWQIFRAVDGNEALISLKKNSFDLILLDINMPGLNGLEVAERLRVDYPNLSIIMVTAQTDFAHTRRALQLGVADYLSKPVIERELLSVLEKHQREEVKIYSTVISQVQEIVQKQFSEKLSLSELAAVVHIHPAYLSRRFHEEVGLPLTEYINQLRLEKAKEWLTAHPGWTIGEVADRAGFASQHYFSTLFRRHVGVSPRQYRDRG